MGYIYLITNKVNNKRYVGQSICVDIETRWKHHRKMTKSTIGRYLRSAYLKYGIDNFKFQIVCVCFDTDCDRFEKEYIKKYDTLAPNGYNLKDGGQSSKQHPDTKELIRKKLKEYMTPEVRSKISENLKGRKISDEQKEKLSKSCKAYWDTMTNEQLENIKKKRKENNSNNNNKHYAGLLCGAKALRKQVGQYDINNNLVEVFESISSASQKTGICHTSISKVCLGKLKYTTAGGFIWKYYNSSTQVAS
jgi:group I intron endonuclease